MLKALSNIIQEVNISRIFQQRINILSDIDDTVDLSDIEI
jgi:phosphatidate phosphatase APP1